MRTIKRISHKLNRDKFAGLQELASAYAREKQEHVGVYHDDGLFGAHKSERVRRDELVKAGYVNGHGLSARMWKLAQKDAYETVKKQWAALADEIRPLIGGHTANEAGQAPCGTAWSQEQLRYAYWLIYTPCRMAELMSGQAPLPKHFKIAAGQRKRVRNYLRRVIRRQRGGQPVVKLQRSFVLDADMYDVKTSEAGTQVIAITGLTPRKRIRIPLTGCTVISGNIRVVLDADRQRVEIHYTATIKAISGDRTGEVIAVDVGLSEVFTDDEGHKYGQDLGKLIYEESERILANNRRRNQLYQVAKKHEKKGHRRKARNIRKFNLGQKKQSKQKRKNRLELERQINTALNAINRKRHPSILVTEKLDIRGKAKSKQMSRQVSLWPRGILQERTEFKASAAGCRRKQVNPAYTSQMCPCCGFVTGKNRNGDRFKCLHCGHEQDADQVAAINLKARLTDPEITLWTPKERVSYLAGQVYRQTAVCRFGNRGAVRQNGHCYGQDSSYNRCQTQGHVINGARNDQRNPDRVKRWG